MRLGEHNILAGAKLIPMETLPGTGFYAAQPFSSSRARRGTLQINGRRLETPALLPVLNLLTGPPSLHRNGATHKFLKRHLIFEDRRPALMTEVLHFTDYPMTPKGLRAWFPQTGGAVDDAKTLDYWVGDSFRELHGNDEGYRPLFFLDSGGFRLLFNREADIAPFGFAPTQTSIFDLQLAYGADIVSSLDYPIPPFLNQGQVDDRMSRSIENAVLLMHLIYDEDRRDAKGKRPFPVLAVHGQTPEQIRAYILRLFARLRDEGYKPGNPFGIGIGSLVPLRVSSGADRIALIVQTAIETLWRPEVADHFDPSRIPVHAFGITGDMIPFLTYLGVDTFDSSSYIKSASNLDYYDPLTWSALDFRKLKHLPCECTVCNNVTSTELVAIQEALNGGQIRGEQARLSLPAGRFTIDIKSDIYGLIAYHNLKLQDREIDNVREAIKRGDAVQHLVGFGKSHSRAQALVEFLAEIDPSVADALGHVDVSLFARSRRDIEEHYDVSLTHDPDAFDICLDPEYDVPTGKDRLLLLACSQAKPYRTSRSHTTVMRFLQEWAGDRWDLCHKVTISGLYGPVPFEKEDVEAVRTYEYLLSSSAKRQTTLVATRLANYLERHLPRYRHVVAYVTAGAYRAVVETAFATLRHRLVQTENAQMPPVSLHLLPVKARGTGTKDLLTHSNLADMAAHLFPDVLPPIPPQMHFPLDDQ
jgi:7-cyano-7-deazaguanine tRNA-ribosyltransferase